MTRGKANANKSKGSAQDAASLVLGDLSVPDLDMIPSAQPQHLTRAASRAADAAEAAPDAWEPKEPHLTSSFKSNVSSRSLAALEARDARVERLEQALLELQVGRDVRREGSANASIAADHVARSAASSRVSCRAAPRAANRDISPILHDISAIRGTPHARARRGTSPDMRLRPNRFVCLDREEDLLADDQRADRTGYRRNEGRRMLSDVCLSDPIPKPYMYLRRDGADTRKQRLAARKTITCREYLSAYIKLLRDEKNLNPDERDFLLRHLGQVIDDSGRKPWPTVRRWSQTVFDSIESGEMTWADRFEQQVERVTPSMPGDGKADLSANEQNLDKKPKVAKVAAGGKGSYVGKMVGTDVVCGKTTTKVVLHSSTGAPTARPRQGASLHTPGRSARGELATKPLSPQKTRAAGGGGRP